MASSLAWRLAGVWIVGASLTVAGAPAVPETDAAATHVLNRLAYGARPGELAAVRAQGVGRWIEQQLHPDRIDDGNFADRVASFATLTLDATTIVRDYERPVLDERRARRNTAGPAAVPAAVDGLAPPPAAATEPATRPAPSAAQRKLGTVVDELVDAKILRAVYSQRQLEAVLTDVWFNHFNVFAGKGATRSYVTAYERDVIRPHVLGRFRDLLGATAKSPAMLFYLDNWENVDPASAQRLATAARRRNARAPRSPSAARPPRGLNENYARELLELHTIGVDGGYTQQDIQHVARAFTGWTMRPRDGSGFHFAAALHDRGAKTVLGLTLPAGGGVDDGERVLDLLAAHPATARQVATVLARRFVSDTPAEALVARAAKRFSETGGDLREVTRAIVTSPEFFAADAVAAKVKTPLEFVASALRATGADVRTARPLARTLRELGMPLFYCQPPTGYADTADAWSAAGTLVQRVNFALSLASGKVAGTRVARDGDAVAGLEITQPAFQQR